MTSVLIVERPGQFREGLLREVRERGAEGHVRDDAMEALASLARLSPQVVVISDDPGPPGALSLSRLVQRKLGQSSVYRLGEPSLADQLDPAAKMLPRAIGPGAIASLILAPKSEAQALHRAFDAPLGSLELGPLLLAIEARWLTGRLVLTRPGTEREISFVRGLPVHARSSVLSERLGAVGVRRGMFDEAQLDRALELAQARGLRLGTALIETGALDAPRLFGALSAQLVAQLTAACNSGSCQARFTIDHGVALRHTLLRLSPLTALLHAVRETPDDDCERVLDELAERQLAGELSSSVVQWLDDLRVVDPEQLGRQVGSVRELRARLRDSIAKEGDKPLNADAVTLALLRSGAFKMHGRSSLVPADLRAGIRTLSPPSIASAVVRCAHSSFSDWTVSALSRAHTPFDLAIDEYLRGKRPPETARALALLGPEAESNPQHAEVYALHLGCDPSATWSASDAAAGVSLAELRARSHALLQRIDALEAEQRAPLPRVQLLQTRAQIERSLDRLPAPDPAPPEPRAPATERGPGPEKPAPKTAADDGEVALTAAIEPLLQQGRWSELRAVLEERVGDPNLLPPGLALLYAIALKEHDARGGAKPAAQADFLGIRAVSQLLGVSEQSTTAIVIAKRALRRRPLDWNQKPTRRVSALLVFSALLLGALVGFLLHPKLLALFWK